MIVRSKETISCMKRECTVFKNRDNLKELAIHWNINYACTKYNYSFSVVTEVRKCNTKSRNSE